jgi:hypothetical protein
VVDPALSPTGSTTSPVTGSIEGPGADSGELGLHAPRRSAANAVRRVLRNTCSIIAYAPSFATIA